MAKYKELKINMTVTPEMILKQISNQSGNKAEPAKNEKAVKHTGIKTEE